MYSFSKQSCYNKSKLAAVVEMDGDVFELIEDSDDGTSSMVKEESDEDEDDLLDNPCSWLSSQSGISLYRNTRVNHILSSTFTCTTVIIVHPVNCHKNKIEDHKM